MALPPTISGQTDGTLHLPRILCLHGGGSSGQVFLLQCRTLIQQLGHLFRFCFAEGPFDSGPAPGMIPTYQSFQPFHRWLRWSQEHIDPGPDAIIMQIDQALHDTMRRDDEHGATGPWVALMGFSQGAKVAASLLLRQQTRAREVGGAPPAAEPNFKFGILLAGSAPLVALDVELIDSLAVVDANQVTTGAFATVSSAFLQGDEHILTVPTLHVHGRDDPGLPMHQQLLRKYCKPLTTRLVEWNGDHRVPITLDDVSPVVDGILALAKETGVAVGSRA